MVVLDMLEMNTTPLFAPLTPSSSSSLPAQVRAPAKDVLRMQV
jgi:hypothetical protein